MLKPTPMTQSPDGSQPSVDVSSDIQNSTVESKPTTNDSNVQQLLDVGPRGIKGASRRPRSSKSKPSTRAKGSNTTKKVTTATQADRPSSTKEQANQENTSQGSTTEHLLKKLSQRRSTARNQAGVDPDALPGHEPTSETSSQTSNVFFEANPGPQSEFLSASEREVLFGGAAGGGKVLLEHQSVLTPSGFKNCYDLLEGDVICDPTGGRQTIIQVHPWQTNEKWEVEFDDGTVYDTVAGHLWYYWVAGNGEKRAIVKTTEQMKTHMDSIKRNPIVPSCSSVDFDSRPYPSALPPYLLGVLLGDGCLVNNSISMTSHEDDWGHYQKTLDLPVEDLRVEDQTIRFVGKTRAKIVLALKDYGLSYIKSNCKFVPETYLWNSEEVRLGVLRGLMDTDGYRDPTRARAEFSTVSSKLAENVTFLARSLGYRVSTYEKIGSYKNKLNEKVNCQKAYRLYITGYDVDNIFSMPRKKAGIFGKQTGRRVVRVEKVGGIVKGRCITVSAKHSLYVSDDFVVTHNSYAMLADPIRDLANPHFSGILFRKSTEELRELRWKSQLLYPQVFPDIKWSERSQNWVMPNGGRLWMTYLDRDEDVLRYQGQAFNWIGFDELTQWGSPFAYNYMRSRLRTTSKTLNLYMRATTNPGNYGAWWVKKMFIDPAPYGHAFPATDIDTGEVLVFPDSHKRAGEPLFYRRFIPSRLQDNPYLWADGEYEANLLSLPEIQRKQLLDGSWDIIEGAAFSEWDRKIHVIEPFEVPSNWRRFRALDYGYTSFSGCVWFAVAPSGQLVVYRDLEVSKVHAWDLADLIKSIEVDADEDVSYGVLDFSIGAERGQRGPTLVEQLQRHNLRWRPADRGKGSRIAGKNMIHRMLQIDEFIGEPNLVFFNTCTACTSQLPVLPLDKTNSEDIDTKSRDHIYDAVRYGVMSRPRPSDPYGSNTFFSLKLPEWTPADEIFNY